jgi:hypothetical protein
MLQANVTHPTATGGGFHNVAVRTGWLDRLLRRWLDAVGRLSKSGTRPGGSDQRADAEPVNRSSWLPLLIRVMKPPPTLARSGVARAQGDDTTISR